MRDKFIKWEINIKKKECFHLYVKLSELSDHHCRKAVPDKFNIKWYKVKIIEKQCQTLEIKKKRY